MKPKEYDHKKIEQKWQTFWDKKKVNQAENSKGNNKQKKKFYSLIEFPYPSGDGLHVGHPRPYIGMDVISRKKRMEGYNVLYPIGWDAFGLPTENYAIKTGKDPRVVTKENSDTFRRQIKSIGISFDWSREINTTDPKYYKWTQWIFLQFLKKGLAYKKKMEINWCPKDKIGLANEEVVAGCCERCGTPVERREKEQWMLAITKYAERLHKDLDDVNYLPQIKLSQRNWIGKSEGAEIEFKIKNPSPALPEGKGEFGYHHTDPKTWKALQDRVLEMKINSTRGEELLWNALKGGKLNHHFRRQHIIGRFIVDFVCLDRRLVIEVDGDIHDFQKKEDAERTEFLKQNGFRVIRFHNNKVISNIKGVTEKISEALKVLPFGEDLGGVIKVFTTRADTLFGATFLAVAPEVAKKLTGKDFGIKNDTEKENKEKIGTDTGLRAINPANGEEIPVWVVNYVSADYGTGAIMAVPAHDERDFEFAKKFNLPIKYVIAEPELKQEFAPKEGLPFVYRKAVECYIRNPKDDTFLLLDWQEVSKWKGPITGGVEEGEDIIEAAKREIHEESGYKNLKFIKELGVRRADFFHPMKQENRRADFYGVLFELINEEKDGIADKEKSKHIPVWISRNKVNSFLTVSQITFNKIEQENLSYGGEGVLVNSGKFNDLNSEKAIKEITKFVGGKIVTKFKLRDWVFSRQRYWGEPIPVIFCPSCAKASEGKDNAGYIPVPEKDLPVELPKVKNYQPTDSGESPLANISKWVNVKCPHCKGKAKRETDTMPNWAGSSWYYLRYTDPKNTKAFADPKNLKYWTPVDWYNGGNEHTTLHLLYSRFWHKFLFDLGLVPTSEPYMKRTSHGIILADGGEKMSKSKGNVINPDTIVNTYGADTLRLYEMFMGPFDQAIAWSEEAIIGPRRFLEKVWKISSQLQKNSARSSLPGLPGGAHAAQNFSAAAVVTKLLHKTIKKVSEDIENMRFNTAISSMMILATEMEKAQGVSIDDYKKFLQILAPFAPHITEELWSMLGEKKTITLSAWPGWDKSLIIDDEVKIAVQINGKVRGEVMIGVEQSEEEVKEKALADQNIIKHMAGANPKKVIYIKGRLINIVV